LPTDPTILPPPPKLSPVQSPSRLDVTNLPSKLANLQPPPTRFGRILPFLGKKGYERFGQRIVLALLQLVFSEIRRWSVGGRWITWELGQFFHATFFSFCSGDFQLLQMKERECDRDLPFPFVPLITPLRALLATSLKNLAVVSRVLLLFACEYFLRFRIYQ
jgi:hypothetical protein